ncbi:MAG: hypothetical protein HY015_07855 [Bacteroidetes bacterium]|nr:hypothetical protein [Bacteroidota bacterium]
MRILVLALYGLLLSLNSFGQNAITPASDLTLNQFSHGFSDFISSFQAKKTKDYKLVKNLFVRAHKEFLKNYRAYSQVNDIFEKGNYDCLSGTYFFANSLEQLGFSYKIYETNYHIFMTVKTSRGEVLLESTDCANGLVTDQNLIKERISKYQQSKTTPGAQLYLSKLRLFHELLPSQLPGLLYFNRAVEAFNKNELINCCVYLEQAWKIYDNPRIEIFTPILLHSIEASSLNESSKEKLTLLLRNHQQSAFHSLASR